MAEKKIIAVMGATGSQGGGLVRAILRDPSGGFAARAITRDVNSEKAKALRSQGAEVVAADVDNEESLKKAFAGAYGAYCVTFFWAHFSPERETQSAANMARAAKHANLQHVIWSTLEDTRKWVPLSDNRMPTLQGKYKVPHFDSKGEADKFFIELGLPVTVLETSFYWDNMYLFDMGPKKAPNGAYAITFPMGNKRLPGIAAEDIGGCAYGIFKKGKEYVRKTVGIAGEHLTGAQMAEKLSKGLLKCIADSGSRAPRISATCSSSLGISKPISWARATSTSRGRSILRCKRSTSGSRRTRTASSSPSRL